VSIIEADRRLNAEEARARLAQLESGPLQINIDLTGIAE
jgi:hypothetical protein